MGIWSALESCTCSRWRWFPSRTPRCWWRDIRDRLAKRSVMALFDIVIARAACPGCGHFHEWRVQYQYGYCRQHEYKLGDRICWFDPPGRPAPLGDHGENVGGLVTVPGLVESGCSKCGLGEGAAVWFRDNVVHAIEITLSEVGGEPERLEPSSGWMRFWSRRVAGCANEDRLELSCRGDRWTVAVADGTGGLSGGAAAARSATSVMAALGAEMELDPDSWCERLSLLDRELEAEPRCGETTLVVVQVSRGELWGASVGDSGALLVAPDGLIELTAAQRRKPLVGSGACRPASIPRQPLSGRLLVATDGLLKYTSLATINALARTGDVHTVVETLIQAVTLPSGNLQDDVAVVLGERVG
ncbi:SpoIIE family protein phosphatase [Sorangium sp. So ce128]|uniref:SpoIIE family protein phosphatase n=1 Tax=Sorangium sp. So ce128 TaxID=3133281 RepID=UPI003F61FBB5